MTSAPTSHFITLPNRTIVRSDGEIIQGSLQIHYWEWNGRKPTILICHGTSFHGRCFDRIVNEALSGFHVIALDFRGHGRSQKHPPPYRFDWFGDDVLQFIESLDLPKHNLIGIGHSLGGYALTAAAAIASRRLFQSLLLLDPVILSPSVYETLNKKYDWTSRRKSQWSSIDDMILKIGNRGSFAQWPEDVLRDYCTYALDDSFQLACSPDGEASIYTTGLEKESSIYQLIRDSKFIHEIPIRIVRSSISIGTNSLAASPTAPDLVTWFKKARDIQLPNTTHLFPMEQPQITVDLVKEFIEEYKNLQAHL